jgi:hypothetical protein
LPPAINAVLSSQSRKPWLCLQCSKQYPSGTAYRYLPSDRFARAGRSKYCTDCHHAALALRRTQQQNSGRP